VPSADLPSMSVAEVQARIGAIQARFAPPPSRPPAGGASSPSAQAFSNALASAMSGAAAPAAPPAPPGAAAGAAPARAAAVESFAPSLRPGFAAAIGRTGRTGPPAELQAYGNGRIPEDALTPLGIGQHRMWQPAAESFHALMAEAQAAGVSIGVTDSYRSFDQQVDLAKRKGLYSQGGLAAKPGTSNHGWGLSLDLKLDAKAQDWMRANGPRFGFVEDVPREPWHWTFQGER
jgi:zinc D-Ala-D-Ala carboxypeptidase